MTLMTLQFARKLSLGFKLLALEVRDHTKFADFQAEFADVHHWARGKGDHEPLHRSVVLVTA